MTFDRNRLAAIVAGFASMLVANTGLAIVVLAPINDELGIARTKEQGLSFPALFSGYLVVAVVLVWLMPLVDRTSWIRRGIVAGASLGIAVSLAGHLITAGWSVARLAPMAFAGVDDTTAAVMGGLAASRVIRTPS